MGDPWAMTNPNEIHGDGIVTDSYGARWMLLKYFEAEDICNELAHQVLAEKWFYGKEVWE